MKISEQIRQADSKDYDKVAFTGDRGPGEAFIRLVMVRKQHAPAQTLAQVQDAGRQVTQDAKTVAGYAEAELEKDSDIRISAPPLKYKGGFGIYGPLVKLKKKGANRDKLKAQLQQLAEKYGYKVI